MDVLTLFGGPRKKGNTARVLGWVEGALETLGHRVERINLNSKKINGCLGCAKCKDDPDKPGCVQKDDGGPIIDRMIQNDAVVFATPLYFWGVSAQMKALVDRCHCLYRGVCGGVDHTSFVEGRRQALVITAADPFENNAELVITAFQRILVYNKTISAGELIVCRSTTPDELGDEIQTQAVAFARQMFEERKRPYALLIPGGAPHYVPAVE